MHTFLANMKKVVKLKKTRYLIIYNNNGHKNSLKLSSLKLNLACHISFTVGPNLFCSFEVSASGTGWHN